MPIQKRPPSRRRDTDWGNEVAGAVGLVGKIFGRGLSYVFNILLTLLLIGLITGAIVGGAFAIYVKNYIHADLDSFDFLATGQSMTTKIYYMDYTDRANRIGTPVELDDQRLYGKENRMWVSYSKMPSYLVEAFVSVEDHRFWDHHGVDWFTTIKASLGFITGTSTAGGSTITQQLIKNVTGDDQVTIQRKVQEWIRALELEKKKSKPEIMELYLNTIFLSHRSYGVAAAAYTYFNKDVSELSLLECAALASIPQYPTRYDPIQYPENNKDRRDKAVLLRMLELGKITQSEYDSAFDKELKINRPTETVGTATNSWYTDAVIEETISLLISQLGITREMASKMIYNSGLGIYTVMNPEIQNIIEDVYEDEANFPSVKGIIQPESSIVIIDPQTGDILGLVGGRGIKTKNRVQSYATQTKRPPGSSIKPLTVYGPSLEYGLITYGSVFDDVPINFGETKSNGTSTVYSRPDGWPSNFPAGYNGLTTINDAVTRSVNTISLHVLTKLGVEKSFDFAKNKFNLSVVESKELTGGKIVTDKDFAPLGLGQLSYGVSVTEMTAAYAAYDNKGVFNSPRTVIKILDSDGNVIVDNNTSGKVVVSEQTASIMTKMLQNVVTSGTAKRITLQNKINCAGKTGTTSDDNDRWFVGYTPYYVGGVWFGYEMPKSLSALGTVSPCVTIWDTIMTRLHENVIKTASEKNTPLKTFTLADGIVTKTYCRDSGKLITDACRADPRGSRAEVGYFTYATQPTEACDVHVMVDYDKKYGGIACKDCPPENVVKYGLLRHTSRNFPVQINVTDAQYVYRNISDDAKICTDVNNAFFADALPKGTYVGLSGSGTQFNCYCPKHYDPNKPEETLPPEEDYEDTVTSETIVEPPKPPVVTEPQETTVPLPETTPETDYETSDITEGDTNFEG